MRTGFDAKTVASKTAAKIRVGTVIRRYRERATLSQQDLAEVLGVTEPWLCKRETGKQLFPFERVLELSRALDADPLLIAEAYFGEIGCLTKK